MPGQVARVHIWPGPGALRVRVRVFKDRRAMHRYWRGERPDSPPPAASAAGFLPFRITSYRRRRARTRPLFGEILLNIQELGAGIVAHEMLHAALEWARRKRISLALIDADDRPLEERLCYAHHTLVVEFWTVYWAREERWRALLAAA